MDTLHTPTAASSTAQHLIRSPAERAARTAEKQRAVLRFLRDEIWSTPEVLGRVMQINARAGTYRTLHAFEREGFLSHAIIPIYKGTSQTIYGITAHGLAFAFDHDEAYEARPTFEPSKVKLTTLQHEIDIQKLRLDAEQAGWKRWVPGMRLGASIVGMKRPDAVAVSPDDDVIAIEIERTIKTTKRYEVLLGQYLQAIAKNHYTHVVWLCPNDDLAARLRRILQAIQKVPVAGKRVDLEPRHARLWSVRAYVQWPMMPEA